MIVIEFLNFAIPFAATGCLIGGGIALVMTGGWGIGIPMIVIGTGLGIHTFIEARN